MKMFITANVMDCIGPYWIGIWVNVKQGGAKSARTPVLFSQYGFITKYKQKCIFIRIFKNNIIIRQHCNIWLFTCVIYLRVLSPTTNFVRLTF